MATHNDIISGMRHRIAEIDQQIALLRAERDGLARFVDSAPPPAPAQPFQQGSMVLRTTVRPQDGSSPSVAVVDFVRENPGRSGKQIVEAVLPTISTESKDPKRMLYSVLSSKERQKAISKVDGRFYVAGHPAIAAAREREMFNSNGSPQ